MSYRFIISDWNGTILRYPTDEAQNKKIAYALLDNANLKIKNGNLSALWDFGQLLLAERELKKCFEKYQKGELSLHEVYEPFNKRVLRGKDYKFVSDVLDQFVDECVINDDVDKRILDAICLAHKYGTKTGILSTSNDVAIDRTLIRLGFENIFDIIESNRFITRFINGELKMMDCTFDINNRKPEYLERRFLRPYNLKEKDVIYFGDSDDDTEIANMLPAGNFIVPFFATNEFREYAAKRFGAFTPNTKEDLDCYLKTKCFIKM
ncbi:MAG: haloacid dehalogenase-like hydrolase [Burkholderiales bacterium]|nr:haloacid dehalogenase-like hydrolase [Nitrosomonas sp.]MCP5274985.1 haloacid dehalogenase-like hydrolase [Burkholderiales bacterium]